MTTRLLTTLSAISILTTAAAATLTAEHTTAQALGILDEKVTRLAAQLEDVQVRQLQTQKDIEKLQADLLELRRAAGSTVTPADLKTLEDRIAAVDTARQRDRQAIIDQLAKELANLGGPKPAPPPTPTGKEHVVAKGETLSAIAKLYGITVADLKRANNLTGDEIRVGQKLALPR
jgi:LysM repeat protein